MAGKRISLDEFMSKRQQTVGSTVDGKEAVFKGFSAPASYNPETRSGEFVMSSETIDRMGDIVRQDGLDFTRFMENPQALLFHSSRQFPIGQWSNLARKSRPAPKRTEGKLNFAPGGGPIPEIDQAAWAVEKGLIRTVSIGFMPLELLEIEHEKGKSAWSWGYDITKSELYECSLVPIPAQPDALAKGMIQRDEMPAAREFLQLALDDWAKDPRTAGIVPRKELEGLYLRFFGKQGPLIMLMDAQLPREKTAIVQVEEALAKAAEAHGLKAPIGVTVEPAGEEAGIDAISGIQLIFNVSIDQGGGTGSNTRVGTEVGDEGAPPAPGGPATPQGAATPEPAAQPFGFAKILERAARIFGVAPAEISADKTTTRGDAIVPGAKAARETRIKRLQERLQATD
jgi:hypothetical protein